jgi:hypothetical protein
VFPTFQGLRNNNGTAAVDAVATPAITLTSEVTPKAKEVVVPELVPEVADMEEMLKELDACGVSCCLKSPCRSSTHLLFLFLKITNFSPLFPFSFPGRLHC